MDEAAERHTGKLAGWSVDYKDWLAGINEWLSDYISWLTGWTVDQLDKRSQSLNPGHLFLYKCQTAVGSVCWPDWEGEREGKRAGREGGATDGERKRGRQRERIGARQGYRIMSVHQYSDSETITAHYLSD